MQTEKIISIPELRDKIIPEGINNGGSFVLCHGNFNVIHPGHLRFLNHAKTLGKKLIVSVFGDQHFSNNEIKKMYPQLVRAQGLSAIQVVDFVVILDSLNLLEALESIKPSVFVMGKDYENMKTGEEKEASKLASSLGIKVIYHSGEIYYESSDLLNTSQQELQQARLLEFLTTCKKNGINLANLQNYLENFVNYRLLIIGDSIVDQYAACEPLGMSAEAPIVVVREIDTKEYVGGAGIVAAHVRALGAECNYLSIVGEDQPANLIRTQMEKQKISTHLIVDQNRPTTFKIRYMVGNQKIFRVSRLQDNTPSKELESRLIKRMEQLIPLVDGVLISDFVYGVVTNRLLKRLKQLAKEYNVKIFGDLQCSSQIGSILRLNGFDLIFPTEREARIALGDSESGLEWLAQTLSKKTKSKELLIKMGNDGFIAFDKENGKNYLGGQHFPALTVAPVDVTGAGDSLFAAVSVSICAGANLMEASAIGACMASIAVQNIGNIPISLDKLKSTISTLFSN